MPNYTSVSGAAVGVLMGSASDWETMKNCAQTLHDLGVAHECNALSAHRNPQLVAEYCKTAADRGLKVLICAAGGGSTPGGSGGGPYASARSGLPDAGVVAGGT